MFNVTFMSASAIATLALAGTAMAAQPVCSARSDILAKLANAYHEQPNSVAVTAEGSLLEVLTSSDDTTWSILITAPNGVSCLVAAGKDWQEKNGKAASDAGDPQI